MVGHLRDRLVRKRRSDSRVVQCEQFSRELAECGKLVVADVAAPALGEPVDEEGPIGGAKQDDAPEAARLALALPSDPLLDDATAEIGIEYSPLGTAHRFHERSVGDPFLAGEAHERLRREDAHSTSAARRDISLSAIVRKEIGPLGAGP
jgi:hypothetical protein